VLAQVVGHEGHDAGNEAAISADSLSVT